jgi:hypothetical protein
MCWEKAQRRHHGVARRAILPASLREAVADSDCAVQHLWYNPTQRFILEGPVRATTWKTKWGMRRVRRENPTIEEALIAAESLADDPAQRAEIAAELMGVPVEEVQALAAKQAAKTRGRASLVAGRTRAVVVEYKRPRTIRPIIDLTRRR